MLVLLSSPRFFGNPLINEAQQLIAYINDTLYPPPTPAPHKTSKQNKKKAGGVHAPHQAHTTPHPPMKFEVINAGSNLLSHTLPGAVPSAPTDLATGFEKDNRA